MRIKILSLTAIAFLATGSLAAETVRDNVGIGLGTIIFQGKDGLLSQICAATTNGSFGNQTFAITSGTLDAKPYDGLASRRKMLNDFVASNMDVLARDMAAGSGESVDALAELMSVPAADRTAFAQKLQTNFGSIYTSTAVTNTQVVENIGKVVGQA